MANYTWTFDAPTGTYKSHTMSAELLRAAIADTVVAPFARVQGDYGRKSGESITLGRVSNLSEPTSPVLSETIRIPEDDLTLTTKAITVQEIGRAVPFTSLADDLSRYDIENVVQRELMKQMRLSLDTLAATAVKSGLIKYAPTGLTSSTVTTTGSFGATATANLNVYHLEEIRDLMYDTYMVPPVEGDDYVGIFRTLGIRGVKRDPAWEEWHKYTDPMSKYKSEVGRIEGIRLIETNHANAFSKVGTGSVLGEGVVFGEDAFALAEALTPELRAAIPSDFGRQRAVAWYGILKFDVIWDTANAGEARILHVGSA